MKRTRLRVVISVGVALVAVAVAITFVARDADARHALRVMSVATLALVLALQLANVVADSLRYRMVLPGRYRSVVPMWSWHRIFTMGRLLNSVVPQSGTAYRAAHLRLGHGVPVATFLGSVAAITWLGNGIALVIVTAVVVWSQPVAGLIVGGCGVAILGAVLVAPRVLRHRLVARPSSRVGAVVVRFGESFGELGSRARFVEIVAVSVLTQVSGAVAFILVAAALGIDAPVVVGSILYASTTIVTVVSLTPGGLGLTELAAGAAAGLLDLGAGVGVLVALVIRVTALLAVGGFGGVSAIAGGRPPVTPPSDAPR